MYVDMLNYGAAAQIAFGYDTDNLVNAALTDAQKAMGTSDSEAKAVVDNREGDSYFKASNVGFENNISFLFAFRNIDQSMKAVITYTTHKGKSVRVEIDGSDFTANGKYWVVELSTLAVADARQTVTCQIIDAEGNLVSTVTDSIESYVARGIETGTEDKVNLFKAFIRFSDSAYAHLHS